MADNFSLDKVVKDYNKTFKAKTSKAKGYTEIKISFEKKEEEVEVSGETKYAPSKLDPKVF